MDDKKPRPCDKCGKMTTFFQHDFLIGSHSYCVTKCEECKEKVELKDEWQNEQFRESTMICPWCETEFDSYENEYEEGTGEVDCPYCEKPIEYEAEISWTFTTRKPERLYEESGEADG